MCISIFVISKIIIDQIKISDRLLFLKKEFPQKETGYFILIFKLSKYIAWIHLKMFTPIKNKNIACMLDFRSI